MKPLIPVLILGLAAVGCAQDGPTGGSTIARTGGDGQASRQCFPIQAVNAFTSVDRETVNIRVGANDVYQMKLFAPCHDIDWALAAGLQASGGGGFICDAMDIDIVAPSPVGPSVCRVASLRKLSDAEVATLPARAQP